MGFMRALIPLDSTCVAEPWEMQGGFVLYILFLLYGSIMLGKVCDDYLVPALEIITQRLEISEDVAGVSLLAFGGSAPELAIHIFATIEKKEIGVGTIIGSAIYNVTFAVLVVSLLVPRSQFVKLGPLTRDTLMYLVAVYVLFAFRQDEAIGIQEAVALIAMYFTFLLFLFFTRHTFVDHPDKESHDKPGSPHAADSATDEERVQERESLIHRKKGKDSSDGDVVVDTQAPGADGAVAKAGDEEEKKDGDESEEEPEMLSRWMRAVNFLMYPWEEFVWYYTIPNCSRPGRERWYGYTFLMSLLWVSLISFFLMTSVQRLGCVLKLDEAFSGLTILALGASLPDTIAMGVTAYRGHGAMAVSGLIGSNIFDVLMGLGLPWLIFNLTTGPVSIANPNILHSIVFLFIAVMSLYLSMLIHRMEITRTSGIIPTLVYVAYIIYEFVYV